MQKKTTKTTKLHAETGVDGDVYCDFLKSFRNCTVFLSLPPRDFIRIK